ncbi:unnamed protein product [Vitrella brassicaformis CCMP3155]|uniref:DUF4460 domain-containing protein n=2 Tax=Vitrella brassicaformis TaxID=1169539 RepID=A0A0G4GYW8_VITBC|nr:unnamed protein product [Vitrella brassicaformis CCMP3155]|eukprot:CEM36233.1 unnamed protein product [Vitrella brassicaformis CCMP3155]
MMHFFFKQIHPDLTPHFPFEAKSINQKSLAELNAYIDHLDRRPSRPPSLSPLQHVEPPVVTRTLSFFKAYRTRRGRLLPGRVQQFRMVLPTIPPGASVIDRDHIAAVLIRDLEVALSEGGGPFVSEPQPSPLFTPKNFQRDELTRLWERQTEDAMKKQAVYQVDEKYQRRMLWQRWFFHKYQNQLLRKAISTKNTRRRKKKLAAVNEQAMTKVRAKFGDDPETPPEDVQAHLDRVRIIESGYHPDLVFVQPGLSPEHRKEGIRRVCGLNLTKESDVWLLENMWKAMREDRVAVPLIIGPKDSYATSETHGFITIPYDFDVWALADFLEEHLEDARDARAQEVGGLRIRYHDEHETDSSSGVVE